MNTKLLNHRIAFASILFIFAISLQSKAQDTIHCFDERYHWTEPCNYSDYPDTVFEGQGVVGLAEFGHMTHDPKPVLVGAIDKTLIQQVFTDTIRKQIYGIAGTTIGCYNPNGCYFYLYKKINNTFVVLDSAEWTHRNATDTEKRYIAYNVGGEYTWDGSLFDIYGDWPTSIPGETLTMPDSNIVEIHEAYFNTPIAVEDTFYVGTNWNGIDVYFEPPYNSNQSFFWLEQPYTSTFIVPMVDSDISHSTTWVIIFPDNTVYVYSESSHRNCFFPIMEPPQCVPINVVDMDSLSANSVHISWERPYLNTYYQIEYGPRGFQHGSGVFIDSVATTHYTLQNLAGGTEYIAYVRSYCSSADTVSNWKSVQFKTLHTECPAVEDLAAYEGTKIASIKWSITDSEIAFCQIEWGEAGFEHGNGTVVNNIHDTTYMLRNLTPNTAYDVYIRTYCERSQVFGAWQKVSFTTTGNNDIADIDSSIPVELHPNPTSGIITLSRTDVMKVEVIDAVGKTVMVVEDKHVIDLSKLSQGYYTLRITLPEGVAIRKVIRK